ncbi:unnamed protein product, partial [Rotaria socialis]
SSSEEQQVGLHRINQIPKYYSNERAFFNVKTNSLERTYPYVNYGSNWQLFLPNMNSESDIISSLLAARNFVVRIGILYEPKSSTQIFYGTGFLLTDRFVLTCSHNFDAWHGEKKRFHAVKLICHALYDDKISDYD